MQNRQKIKHACIIPLDIWKEEINHFVKNISAKLNVTEDVLFAWIHEQGIFFFNEAQQNCYLKLLESHPFPKITMAYMEMQISKSFDSLYQNLLKAFLSSDNTSKKSSSVQMFGKNSSMNKFLQDDDDEEKVMNPTDAAFQVLIKESLSQHPGIIASNTVYLCNFHQFLQNNPSMIVNDEIINNFKLDILNKITADISQLMTAINEMQKNTASTVLKV